MISSHATVANTTIGQVRGCYLHNGFVDACGAALRFPEKFI